MGLGSEGLMNTEEAAWEGGSEGPTVTVPCHPESETQGGVRQGSGRMMSGVLERPAGSTGPLADPGTPLA